MLFNIINIIILVTILAINVAIAAPKTPNPQPNINTAFNIMLITFIIAAFIIEIFEFPIALNNPAPELYSAIKGYEIAVT